MLNSVIVTGLLGKFHDVKISQSGKKMATFSIWQKRKDYQQYIPVIAFDRQAEFFEKYVKDGANLECIGELSVSSRQTADGRKETKLSFVAKTINIVGAKEPEPVRHEDPAPAPVPASKERFNDDLWNRSLEDMDIDPDSLPF